MEEKYGKLNDEFRENIKHLMLSKMKKQQNRMFVPDVRGTQKILSRPTENKTVRDSWGNTDTV